MDHPQLWHTIRIQQETENKKTGIPSLELGYADLVELVGVFT